MSSIYEDPPLKVNISTLRPGLNLRHYAGESDLEGMAATLNASERFDGNERVVTVDEMRRTYQHLNNSDASRDVIIAEMADEIAGYLRVEWQINTDGERLYSHLGFVNPEQRRKGVGAAMLKWGQARLREIAASHPDDGPKLLESWASEKQTGLRSMLEKDDYRVVRWGYDMCRPDLNNIVAFGLPIGLEVRPVLPEHYSIIWAADREAFRDHWGYAESNETHYQAWLANKVIFKPDLWKIAWDTATGEVAGQVRGFIDEAENESFGRRRGYCEFISVRRPWRRRGLARALIALTLREFKARGMTEAALGVDAQNPNGAVRVYEDCGFRVVKTGMLYRRPLE